MIFAQVPTSPPPAQPATPASPFEQLPLRDIHLPAEPSLWPLAPGWWAIIALGAVVLGWLTFLLVRRLQRRAHLRRVLALLEQQVAEAGADGARQAAEVSMLLRRVALTRYPKQEVASLSGQRWLEFLDRTGGNGAFAGGPGRVLAEGPWQAQLELDPAPLTGVARRWLEANL